MSDHTPEPVKWTLYTHAVFALLVSIFVAALATVLLIFITVVKVLLMFLLT